MKQRRVGWCGGCGSVTSNGYALRWCSYHQTTRRIACSHSDFTPLYAALRPIWRSIASMNCLVTSLRRQYRASYEAIAARIKHDLEGRTRAATVVALLGLCGLLFGGCASTAVQAQWADPQFAGRSLRGGTALVVCNANAPAIQRICQDQ